SLVCDCHCELSMLLSISLLVFWSIPRPPRSPLFPYTTLFRSRAHRPGLSGARCSYRADHRLLELGVPARRAGATRRPTRATAGADRKSTRLNSSHVKISYAVFCLKKKKIIINVYNTGTHTTD